MAWNGKSLGDWVQCVDGAYAIVNLTGRSVNCPHTPENLREINESRINSVNALAAAIHKCLSRRGSGCRRGHSRFTVIWKINGVRKVLRWAREARWKPAGFGKMRLGPCLLTNTRRVLCESASCWPAMAARFPFWEN